MRVLVNFGKRLPVGGGPKTHRAGENFIHGKHRPHRQRSAHVAQIAMGEREPGQMVYALRMEEWLGDEFHGFGVAAIHEQEPQTSVVDTSTPGQQIASGGGLLGGSAVYAPTLNVRSADTVVVTPDAQTVVIGGLISNTKSASDSKVPLLGDIPLLGMLFKSSAKSDTKTELLMFLTPHIVKSPTMLAAMAVNETGQASAITNSVSELELNRFLERVPAKKN